MTVFVKTHTQDGSYYRLYIQVSCKPIMYAQLDMISFYDIIINYCITNEIICINDLHESNCARMSSLKHTPKKYRTLKAF